MSNSAKAEAFKGNGQGIPHGAATGKSDGSRTKAANVFADMTKLREEQAAPLIETAELLVGAAVRKPSSGEFFRVHPDPAMSIVLMMYQDPTSRAVYLVMPSVREVLGSLARPATFVTCINQAGAVFLWPIKESEGSGMSSWSDSAKRVAFEAQTKWVRLIAEMKRQQYRAFWALGELPEPEWSSKYSLQDYLTVAFDDTKIIDSLDHAVMRASQGKPQT